MLKSQGEGLISLCSIAEVILHEICYFNIYFTFLTDNILQTIFAPVPLNKDHSIYKEIFTQIVERFQYTFRMEINIIRLSVLRDQGCFCYTGFRKRTADRKKLVVQVHTY